MLRDDRHTPGRRASRIAIGVAYLVACASQLLLLRQEARERARYAADQRRAAEIRQYLAASEERWAREAPARAEAEALAAQRERELQRQREEAWEDMRQAQERACQERCKPLLQLSRPQQPDPDCLERCRLQSGPQ